MVRSEQIRRRRCLARYGGRGKAAHRRAGAGDAHVARARRRRWVWRHGPRARGLQEARPGDVDRGVGSKVLVAAAAGIHDTVGEDLVNHSVNDILVHGAAPLAFLDYIATGNLVPEIAAQIVSGVARGCRAHDMTLAGGETAQMPDLYQAGHYDLAGSIVGVVEEDKALHGDRVTPGDQLIGYASTGLHTNGYTLARKIVFDAMQLKIDDPFPETGQSVGQVLLAVHRSYATAVRPVLDHLHALAHVTGGGIAGNLVRVLPPG